MDLPPLHGGAIIAKLWLKEPETKVDGISLHIGMSQEPSHLNWSEKPTTAMPPAIKAPSKSTRKPRRCGAAISDCQTGIELVFMPLPTPILQSQNWLKTRPIPRASIPVTMRPLFAVSQSLLL